MVGKENSKFQYIYFNCKFQLNIEKLKVFLDTSPFIYTIISLIM